LCVGDAARIRISSGSSGHRTRVLHRPGCRHASDTGSVSGGMTGVLVALAFPSSSPCPRCSPIALSPSGSRRPWRSALCRHCGRRSPAGDARTPPRSLA
jgi:hypothetical protein